MSTRRPLAELISKTDAAWPLVLNMIAQARNTVEALPVERRDGERTLSLTQVTTRSPMGAIAYESGGLLVDQGWVRVLGGGGQRLNRDLATWNYPEGPTRSARKSKAMLVADDVLGGFFALNGGAFGPPLGNVFYLAPETLRWEDLGKGYSDFLQFLFQGDLDKFYGGYRWRNWVDDIASLPGDRAYLVTPFLFASEGGAVEERTRAAVPIAELWNLYAVDFPKQLASLRPGSKFRVKLTK